MSCYNVSIGAITKFSIPEFLIGMFYSNNLGGYDAPSNATWFITTLFLVEILFYVLKRVLKTDKELLFGVSLLGIIGYANSISKYHYDGPWHIQVVFTAIVLYYIGYIFMKNIEWFKNIFNTKLKTIGIATILIIVGIYFVVSNTRVSMTADKYGSIIYFYIASIALSFSLIFIFIKFLDRDIKILKYIGQNTILWLSIQIPIIRLCQALWPIFKMRERYALVLAVMVYFIIIPISLVINKFLPVIVGKKYKNKQILKGE